MIVEEAVEEVRDVVAAGEVRARDDLAQVEGGRPRLAVLLEAYRSKPAWFVAMTMKLWRFVQSSASASVIKLLKYAGHPIIKKGRGASTNLWTKYGPKHLTKNSVPEKCVWSPMPINQPKSKVWGAVTEPGCGMPLRRRSFALSCLKVFGA